MPDRNRGAQKRLEPKSNIRVGRLGRVLSGNRRCREATKSGRLKGKTNMEENEQHAHPLGGVENLARWKWYIHRQDLGEAEPGGGMLI